MVRDGAHAPPHHEGSGTAVIPLMEARWRITLELFRPAASGASLRPKGKPMQVASLVLPVFAIIVTGWLAGWLGYISRSLADALVQFAYNIAMPALLIVTIAQEPARNL